MYKHAAFSKSAPTSHTEFGAHGYPLAPIEYQDHGADIQQVRAIIADLDDNTQRIQNITDFIIQLFQRIK